MVAVHGLTRPPRSLPPMPPSGAVWLRSCPRCRGDVSEREALDGKYRACLQCGHELTEGEVAAMQRRVG